MVHQKQKENMPAVKKLYNPIPDFFIPEKQYYFRVRVVVQTVEPTLQEQQNTKSYMYVVLHAKSTENALLQ